jgi:hypothetical protein
LFEQVYLESLYRGPTYSIEAILAQSTRIDMPSIDEQHHSKDAAAARAILRESEELKNLLESGLRRLENNETFAANDFQKGAVRALIDCGRPKRPRSDLNRYRVARTEH